jgi:uncharacterized protein (DUF433 family)
MSTTIEQHIEITPDVRGGKPRIAGTRLAVADIALLHLRLGQTVEEIAGKYDLTLADVHAAMAYYYDHRKEIEQSIEDDAAYAEAFRRNNPSLLQAKLRTLGRD